MKTVCLLTVAALLSAQLSSAQNNSSTISLHMARNTAAVSKLIHVVDLISYGSSYIIADSTAYYYSGGRSGDLTHMPLKYDDGMKYTYNSIADSYTKQTSYVQTFDVTSNLLTNLSQNRNAVTGSWVNNTMDTYTYDGTGNQLTDLYQVWDSVGGAWMNNSNTINTYDTHNNLLTNIYQTWTSGAWVSEYMHSYTYDSVNNELSYTDLDWVPATSSWVNDYRDTMTYSTTHQKLMFVEQLWDAGAWINARRITDTFNTSDDLTVAFGEVWDYAASTWTNDNIEHYTYDASHDELTELYQYWSTSAWANGSYYINAGFVDTRPESVIRQDWNDAVDSFVNDSRSTYTYNTLGQTTSFYTSTWDPTAGWSQSTADEGFRYYYGGNASLVNNISNNNCTASVYPIPTKDQLHVAITWNEPQAFSIEIMDMSGRVLNTRQMPVCTSYDGNITLGNLPAGNYIMKMTGTNAQSMQQIVIVK